MNGESDEKIVQAEIEGDRYTWWYVCSECHVAIDYLIKNCPCCKRKVDWAGVILKPKEKV